MVVSQRQNLDLVTQQAAAELELIPLKQQQAQIAVDIMATEQQRAAIARQTAVDQARLSGQPSSRALEDSQYRQQLIQAQIRAGVMGGTGIPAGSIPELIELKRGQAALELAALQGGRGVTLASREAETGGLQTSVGTAGARMAQADLGLAAAKQQLVVDALQAQLSSDRLNATQRVADDERKLRIAQDKLFDVGQRKQELAPTINNFTYEQHITSSGAYDAEAAKRDAIEVFTTLMVRSANTGAPAPSSVPGASY